MQGYFKIIVNLNLKKMKNFIKLLIIWFVLISVCDRTKAQTEIEIYTPNGGAVRAYNQIPEMDNDEKIGWSNNVELYFS